MGFELQSGIADEHAAGIAKAMKRLNCFLFVRPTEYASTILIKAGYATKSMDVHHKSSNWGPMAGFVPVDPAFSKKFTGTPDPDPLRARGNEVHGVAERVHLKLKPEVISALTRGVGNHPATMAEVTGYRLDGVTITRGQHPLRRVRFYQKPDAGGVDFTNRNPKQALFLIDQDLAVWWVHWTPEGIGKKTALYVWAYNTNPVTGDYDLWMVAPHITWWKLHTQIVGVTDEHSTSAASLFTNWLLKYLNRKCKRSDNPVFQHGAEAQNYGFTQTLDSKFAMFTPGGTHRIVERDQMAKILTDVQNRGYLVIWNKRYGEDDPHLSHKADARALEASALRQQLEEVLLAKRKLKQELRARQGSSSTRELELMRAKKEVLEGQLQAKLGNELFTIFRFHDKLQKHLHGPTANLLALDAGDFPKALIEITVALRDAQKALQERVVRSAMGGGRSDLDSLEEWLYGDEGNAVLNALLAIEGSASLPKYFFKGEDGSARNAQQASSSFLREVFSLERGAKPGEFVKPGASQGKHSSRVAELVRQFEPSREPAE